MMHVLHRDHEVETNAEGLRLPPADAILVAGVVQKFGFHPGRLEEKRADVLSMLGQLPAPFRKGSGDGWTFLNACVDIHGHQWGEQLHVEALMCLGLGLKAVDYLLPRDVWPSLPGGVPYFVVKEWTDEPTAAPEEATQG